MHDLTYPKEYMRPSGFHAKIVSNGNKQSNQFSTFLVCPSCRKLLMFQTY